MRETGERAAVRVWHQRMQLGKALDVRLVDNRPLPRHFRLARGAPGEGRVDDAAFLHQRGAVAFVIGEILVGMVELVAEQLRSPAQPADQLLGVGIEHELVGIEAVSRVGFVGAVDAVAIDGAGTGRGQIAVPDFVGVFWEFDPLQFGLAVVVEQAELDLGGMGRKQREIDAEPVPGGAKRKRLALADAGAAQARGRPRQGVVRMYCLIHRSPYSPSTIWCTCSHLRVARSPTVAEVITATGGTSSGLGSVVALCSAASLLIAAIELPIRSTMLVSSASDSPRRFLTRRT